METAMLACNVTFNHLLVTTEALVPSPEVLFGDSVHIPGVLMSPSYPAGALQDDASLEQDAYTVPHTLAPCDGDPNSH
jgi:hypothetical protein